MSTTKLSPTFFGYVGSTKDALLIIQEIIDKQIELVHRRPIERERPQLIKSGNVFVFIEEQSGIKRWTDGIAWSPSRILGRFLVYRELDKHSQNEKDCIKKKKPRRSADQDPLDITERLQRPQISNAQQLIHRDSYDHSATSYNNKNSMGTLSYVFRDQGLIKKTLSLLTSTEELHMEKRNEKQTIHLISYYNADDVLNGKLKRPSETDLKNLSISNSLWNAVKDSSLGGKTPVQDEAYYFLDSNYQLQNLSLSQQDQKRQQNVPAQYLPQKYQSTENFNHRGSIHQPFPPQGLLYMLAGSSQEHNGFKIIDSSSSIIKHEDDTISNSSQTAENGMTFMNPFTGAPHQINLAYNSQLGCDQNGLTLAGGPTPGPQTGVALFNMVQPQQFSGYSQPTDSNNNNAPTANGGIISHYAPFPQHFAQQAYPHLGQPGGYPFGSISGLSDQLSSSGGISSSSVNSIASNVMLTSGSNSISNMGTANSSSAKMFYRNSSEKRKSGSTDTLNTYKPNGNSGWFTTNPPINMYQQLTGDLAETLATNLAFVQHQIHHHPRGRGNNYGSTQSPHASIYQGIQHHYDSGHHSHNTNDNNSDI
jgi:hypothetical protein